VGAGFNAVAEAAARLAQDEKESLLDNRTDFE
jgi:hypothetical protein